MSKIKVIEIVRLTDNFYRESLYYLSLPSRSFLFHKDELKYLELTRVKVR